MRRGLKPSLSLLLGLAACLVATPASGETEDVIVTRDVTVREEPRSRSPRVDYVVPGERLDLLDEGLPQNGYYRIRLEDGREGWVYRSFVRKDRSSTEAFDTAINPNELRVHFIDVDQGNAMLLEFPCAAVLVDVGGRGDKAAMHLLAYLRSFFERRSDLNRSLAAIFVTHTHIDHNSNLRRLIDGRYAVGSYIHNGLLTGSGRADARWMAGYADRQVPKIVAEAVSQEEVEAAGPDGFTNAAIDPVACPSVDPKIRLLSGGRSSNPGWSADDFKNGNNHSVVIRVDFGEASFLFPGDLENAGIADLLRRYNASDILDVDVLAVSHHGAANGTTRAFLGALTPRMAVISMGPSTIQEQWTAWAYGHPRKATVDLLYGEVSDSRAAKTVPIASGTRTFADVSMDRAIYATGWDGDVVITANRSGQLTARTNAAAP